MAPAQYLTLAGVPQRVRPANGEVFFWLDSQGAWRPSEGDLSSSIDDACVQIHDALACALFGTCDAYYVALGKAPAFLSEAGMNSESKMSRELFEKAIRQMDQSLCNRLLYLYDCQKLVTGVQECSKEVMILQGEFYRTLNLEPLFHPSAPGPDGVRWFSSPATTKLHATLGVIYVRLHSLLDYLTRLAYEIEHLHSDFTRYPRYASKNIVFGDRKRLTSVRAEGTIFESCDVVQEVELLRNQIIHAGLLDDMPKAYQIVADGRVTAKFILLPDRGPEGQFEKHGNRSLFFSREDRINLRLPRLVRAFQEREVATLLEIRRPLLGMPLPA